MFLPFMLHLYPFEWYKSAVFGPVQLRGEVLYHVYCQSNIL